MYKIFSVKKDTNVEEMVKKLINEGFEYISTFEKEMGILDFCRDLEVILDGFIDANLFIIIEGFSEHTNYKNLALHEITVEQLKTSLTRGYSISYAGTNRLLQSIGYNLNRFNEYLNEIEFNEEEKDFSKMIEKLGGKIINLHLENTTTWNPQSYLDS
ncbi:hypothetical protein P4159_00575 [Bacillus thuringiensis]|uniref:Uncharacterized protein n=1 Tax=Bacillus thuringiensis subsp. kurstaki TaxID=29339 RepID=Q3YN45_BACTK|nr:MULTISPECIES: hypothetical protein [Bacillus cereus group]MEB9963606.1 hypothetical protein [Bacillus cereus]AAZ06600.1 hypothetical protein pAW63_030 [Bacillus thuringiensis serovar kurstaki]AGE81677.1 hypothetical protein HD73_7530 [Bacillus thuringiensis serovar kurstaki str. HD73]AND11259.1 hypothetical protein Bt4C1_28805 [Bacillus thuringiensis serovar alesti]EJV73142.1 hypothetical protein IG1_05891 [Bacillus cereus HD73]